MSFHNASVATHAPQSLPPFAQAFSNTNLGNISSGGNALPPIQSNANENRRVASPSNRSRPPSEEAPGSRVAGKKRARADITSPERDDQLSDSERHSPHIVQIKEEQEQDSLHASPKTGSRHPPDPANIPPPSSLQPSPSKRRRAATLSGAPHALNLNTDLRLHTDQTNSTPISPVVRGFTIRDDPAAIEQVRSSISISQQQKALIEQRRGSVAGILSPGTSRGTPPQTAGEERTAQKSSVPQRTRRSPNPVLNVPVTRRAINRPPSPNSIVVPSQQPQQAPGVNTLGPPPISFARRRAGFLGGKRKPADIVISPREAHTQEQFAPAIQSAPPIPQAGGQAALYSGRFPMTLPRLPSVASGGDSGRKVGSGIVPPTPTRLAMQQRMTSGAGAAAHPIPAFTGRSPPVPSVPISSTLVPPTPSALQYPGYSGDKSAFLAPFEMFYDALNDSKQLKNWLAEQLAKSNTLIQSLAQQQERLNETVEALVERRTGGMKTEMASLRRRVDELEDMLRDGGYDRTDSGDVNKSLRNGATTEPYAFPPGPSSDRARTDALTRNVESHGWGPDKERDRDYREEIDRSANSPASFDARRHSTSAARLDPPRSHHQSDIAPPSTSPQMSRLAVPSPPQAFREGPGRGPSPLGKVSNTGQRNSGERPSLNRQSSSSRLGSHRPSFQLPSTEPNSEGRQGVVESTRKGENRDRPESSMDET
ncbi:hypothetical protein EYR40_009698 [Pleurotus pulmonarius]|nr:hypothetical protein EYR38_002739 [Pleurotus pulmonarius]KAF4591098.1 hypothetical protein EYR40_009698 [Pleurotus pulmonarius]